MILGLTAHLIERGSLCLGVCIFTVTLNMNTRRIFTMYKSVRRESGDNYALMWHALSACGACVCGQGLYPAAAAASLLLLLLFYELHGGSRGRSCSHGSDHLDAVLREWGQAETLSASHRHLLELLEPPQRKLEDTMIQRFVWSEFREQNVCSCWCGRRCNTCNSFWIQRKVR